MVKKISKEQLNRLKGEEGTRVLTKKRFPKPVVEPIVETVEEPPKPSLEISEVAAMIANSNKQVVDAINNIPKPETPVEVAVVPTIPIKNIHVCNIERNGQNRIESADFNVTYEELH